MKNLFRNFVFACIATAAPSWASLVLTLDPQDGTVSGLPGSTVGWGFTLTTDDPNTYIVNFVEFCIGAAIPETGTCNSTPLGEFTPIAAMNGLFIGPDFKPSGYSESFDATALTGLGSFSISPFAAEQQLLGNIYVYFDAFDGNPFDGADQLPSGSVFRAAQVNVGPGGEPPSAVPEPGSVVPVAILLGAFILAKRRRRFR